MEIRFSGVLNKDEFIYAAKLGQHSKKSQFVIELWLVLFAVGIFLIGLSFWLFSSTPSMGSAVLFIVGIILSVLGFKFQKTLDEVWEKNDILRVRRDGIIQEDSIEIRTASAQSRIRWTEFSGYGESEDKIVLFQGVALVAHLFSRRYFQTEEDWLQFRSMVKKKLPLTHRMERANKSNLFVWLLLLLAILAILSQLSNVD